VILDHPGQLSLAHLVLLGRRAFIDAAGKLIL
jgi:hypothetical protein